MIHIVLNNEKNLELSDKKPKNNKIKNLLVKVKMFKFGTVFKIINSINTFKGYLNHTKTKICSISYR